MVLGLLLTLFQGLAAIGYLAFAGVARLAVAAALITGTILLIRRRHAGRWVTAGAAIAVIVLQMADYGVRSGVLPTSGSTRRWLDEARLRRRYPPYPT